MSANVVIIEKDIVNATNASIRSRVAKNARIFFENKKAKLIMDLLVHPVTMDIQGRSFLFGFIGFNDGDDPIEPILDIFEQIDYSFNVVNKGFTFNFESPSVEEVFAATPLPWAEGRSWTKMIESGGIPGLGMYLQKEGKGRSQEGIQRKKGKSRGGQYRAQKYISHIIREYEKSVRRDFPEILQNI